VTTNSAIILLEVNNVAPVTIFLVPRGGGNAISKTEEMPRNEPKVFFIEGLEPDTLYDFCFSGLSRKALVNRVGTVRTFPPYPKKLSIAAVSCDRPERVLDGETNMWSLLEEKVRNNEVQIVLHLGDQVYGQKELVDSFVILRQAKQDGLLNNPENIKEVSYRVLERLADIYRFNWNLRKTAQCLANGSHLMIWSDNDLYNDFTIAKEGSKALSNAMIHYGHLSYRAYQRQLWDPNFIENPLQNADEFHYHKYGNVGVVLLDMRGNRIDWQGNQHADNPILNDDQWNLLHRVFNDPENQVILLCSEIPFVSDEPAVAKKNALNPDTAFVVDHWAYNSGELIRLLEMAFDWKAAGNGKRELVFIGGDIHVGVESEIFDNQTKLSAKHLTATPITNHVCKFFPKLEGKVDERFSYKHTPVNVRNYGLVDITFADDGTPHVNSRLIGDPNPLKGAH
jgi:phosphodiesterase/alkaline phosphatase D-like protein